MNLPEGTHLAYDVRHEAWYWITTNTIREAAGQRHGIVVMASANGAGGGVAWEFSIEDHADLQPPHPTLRLLMFDDSWAAFTQMPEFFGGLTELGPNVPLTQVRELLDQLGAIDETARTSPYEETRP